MTILWISYQDSLIENLSMYIIIIIVPDAPIINIIPTYSQQNDSLLRIAISFPEMVVLIFTHLTSSHLIFILQASLPFFSSGSFTINGSPISYYVTYVNASNHVCDSETIFPDISCMGGECIQEFDVTLSSCNPFNQVSITVLAANMLGNGSMSNSITIGQFSSIKLH